MTSGFGVLLAKEAQEIRRTWRIWVVPGMLLFFAVTGPVMALLTPRLLASLASQQPGVVIRIPDPTALDAYAQFIKGLSQMVIIALVIGGAGAISGERSSGTAILVLTKPVSRGAFVMAKVVAELSLLVTAAIVTTFVTLGVTRLAFPPASPSPLFESVAIWLVHGALIVCATTFFSAALRTRGAAAGAGLGFLLLQALLGIWPAVERHTFVGLTAAMGSALRGAPYHVAWPMATAVVAMLLFIAGAIAVFSRKEI